jgi:hypothetical protein
MRKLEQPAIKALDTSPGMRKPEQSAIKTYAAAGASAAAASWCHETCMHLLVIICSAAISIT